jgi:hypothetical protein
MSAAVPENVLAAAKRLYLGRSSKEDDDLVTTSLWFHPNRPADPECKGFWVLSLHAQFTAKARYKSVSAWLAGKATH